MKVELRAGAEIEVLTQKELAAELDKVSREIRRQIGSRPRVRRHEASIVLNAAGAGTIDLGAPPVGMAWDVRRINVTGQDPAVAFVGVVVVYRGNEAGMPLNYVDDTNTAPNVSTWAAWQFTLAQGESLLARVTGGVAGTAAFASGQSIELPHGEVFAERSEA